MKTIAIFNRKGGVGKTTMCVNIAACLDRVYGKKVLVIDCDTQSNATSYLAGDQNIVYKSTLSTYFKKPEKTLEQLQYNHLINNYEIVLGDVRQITVHTKEYYIAADEDLDYTRIKSPEVMKQLLDKVDSYFDYCIIDCPPGNNTVCANALTASDYIVVPVMSGKDAINGYQMVVNIMNGLRENGFNERLSILGLILNNVDKRIAHDKYYQEMWDEEAKGKVFDTIIHNASVIKDAREFGKPIHYYQRTSNAAKEISALTQEIMDRLEADINGKV